LKKLILIDGSSILSTSFYGNLPMGYVRAKTREEKEKALAKVLQTSTGIFTNAIYTMTKVLLSIIEKQKPTHLAVAWDITRDTFRRELYGEYKANRDETPSELKSQFILMQKLLERANIPSFSHQRYEADDILGTLSRKFEEEISVYILTKDQDALQLVNEQTRVWLVTSKAKQMYMDLLHESSNLSSVDLNELNVPNNTFEFSNVYVSYFYGLEPIQIIDKKALEGDASDNIPGVKGVGQKSAVPLLQEFRTVEGLYESLEDMSVDEIKELMKTLGIKKSPVACLLRESQDDSEISGKRSALLSKQLATIVTNIPGYQDLSLGEFQLNINRDGMRDMFKELEFTSLLK